MAEKGEKRDHVECESTQSLSDGQEEPLIRSAMLSELCGISVGLTGEAVLVCELLRPSHSEHSGNVRLGGVGSAFNTPSLRLPLIFHSGRLHYSHLAHLPAKAE